MLEGVADKLGIQVSDDEVRADLKEEGESDEDIEEFMAAGGADRVRPGLPAQAGGRPDRRRGDPDLAGAGEARESIWTPGKEEGAATEKKLWTPGS